MAYDNVTPPAGGKITIASGILNVPENPVIPFIRGDGTGRDIWAASERVLDAAVEKAYGGTRKISWFEVFAGEASKTKFDNWLPDDTIKAFQEYLVGIKGPLTTPVGGGIRSLNVALRQMLEEKLVKRKVSLKSVEYGKVLDAASSTVRQIATLNAGISSDKAKAVNRAIKELGLKGISSQTQGDQVRVTGTKRDDLQDVIAGLKEVDLDIPLQFINFRD